MRRTDFSLPTSWDRPGLEASEFSGFVPLVGLAPSSVPKEKGVYAVLRPEADAHPLFLEASPLKAYPLAELEARWVAGAAVVYVGKAGPRTNKGGLRSRLSEYSRKARNHSGGRSIWQLEDADQLLVCWSPTPGLDPRQVELDLLDDFTRSHGAMPFANIEGRRRASVSGR